MRSPSIPLSFILANVSQVEYLLRWLRLKPLRLTPSIHRLRRGLPGYLILFAPPRFRASVSVSVSKAAFATECSSNIYAFRILEIPPLLHSSLTVSKQSPRVKPWVFTSPGLPYHLRTLLHPTIPDNALYMLPRLHGTWCFRAS